MRKEHPEVRDDRHVDYSHPWGVIKSPTQTKTLVSYQKSNNHQFEICPICDAMIESDNMEFHQRAAHPVVPPDEESVPLGRNGLGPLQRIPPPLICPICKLRLKSQAKLEKHMAIHSKTKPIKRK
jgi:hypothetical protein